MDIIKDMGFDKVKIAPTPLPAGLKFISESEATLEDPSKYRRLVGRLLYLGFTRPDISYATQQLNQYIQQPYKQHWNVAVDLVRYLKGQPSSDWTACQVTRRSLTGYCIMMGSNPVSWKTKKRSTMFRSSAEAEYRSMATTSSKLGLTTFDTSPTCREAVKLDSSHLDLSIEGKELQKYEAEEDSEQ
ncbi:uncharacterized protein LOC110011382 [Sesamum indicum]|uniref:Uncharacterized protein LOC110011382 n=1 Tax=Sesamum indicum TaxID=4182 RepID=A0A8M8UKA4_SESIN|nr:uncharacterized protein LOC110011382 [Sesamum indicum]